MHVMAENLTLDSVWSLIKIKTMLKDTFFFKCERENLHKTQGMVLIPFLLSFYNIVHNK